MISLPYDNISEIGYFSGGFVPYTNNEIQLISIVSEADNSSGYVYNNFPIISNSTYEYNILSSEVEWRGAGKVELELKAETFSEDNIVSIVITDTDFTRYVDNTYTNNRQFIVNINPQKIGVKLIAFGVDNKTLEMGGMDTNFTHLTNDNMYYGYRCFLYDRATGAELCFKYTNNHLSDSIRTDICISTKNGFRQFIFNDNYGVNFSSDYYNENSWGRNDRGADQTCIIDNTVYMNGLAGTFEVIRETGTGYINRYDYAEGLQYKIIFTGIDTYYSGNIKIEHVFTKDMLFNLLGCYGLYVKIDTVEYMPEILEDRKCTGRLIPPEEQADTDSLIKDLTDTTPTIITPVHPMEDNIVPIHTRYLNELTGFIKYYKMTNTDLDMFLNACESAGNALTGFEYLPYITSIMQYPFNVSDYVATGISKEHIKINGVTLDGDYDGHTGFEGTGYKLESFTVPKKLIGTTTVKRLYNNFLDYAPYTTIEVYITMCGFVTLPSECMGKTIEVYLINDVISGSCKGVVYCQGIPVAERTGTIAQSITITGTETGLKRQALLNNAIGLTSAGVGLIAGATTGNSISLASSGISAIGSVTQAMATANNSYTRTAGKTGTATDFFDSSNCYIKITRPVVNLPSNYGHSIGYISNKTSQLINSKGFTIVHNPDITGVSCDYAEGQEIKSLLASGVIIK